MVLDTSLVVARMPQVLFSHYVLAIASLIAVHLVWNKLQPGLTKIPGPTLAAYTRLWRMYDVWKGHAHLTAIELHKKHGPVVRIGPNHVSIADPKMMPIVYNTKETFTKTAFYPLQSITWKKQPEMNLFSTRDPEFHRVEKRKVGPAYSLSSLLQSEQAVDSCSDLFMSRLGEFALKKEPVDLGAWFEYYAFDVVGEVSFASKLGFLEQGKDIDGTIKAMNGIMAYGAIIGQVPEYHNLLFGNPLLSMLMPPMETWNQVVLFGMKAIKGRATMQPDGSLIYAHAEGHDMLSRWTQVKTSDADTMSTRDIVVHMSSNIFAGSGTTAIALRAIIYFLCRHPTAMKKLVREIDDANAAGKLSNPISYREGTTVLPYLGAVVKEAMRLHPSVGLLMERHVPAQGLEVGGYHLPAGTVVGINAWVTGRDQDVYPDPDSFKPERWLEASSAQLKEMEALWEFNFGFGSRTCLGRHISMIEIHKVIPQLLNIFTVELTHPEREWTICNYFFVQQEGLICTLTRR